MHVSTRSSCPVSRCGPAHARVLEYHPFVINEPSNPTSNSVSVNVQILTSSNLASFSFVDAVQTLLGRRLEVLQPSVVAQLAGLAPLTPPLAADHAPPGADSPPGRTKAQSAPAASRKGGAPGSRPGSAAAGCADEDALAAAALRLGLYSSTRVEMVMQLLARLATIAETFELARATGLTLASVLYNAQMIRTWSLLLRRARESAPAYGADVCYILHRVSATG